MNNQLKAILKQVIAERDICLEQNAKHDMAADAIASFETSGVDRLDVMDLIESHHKDGLYYMHKAMAFEKVIKIIENS